MMIVIYDDIFKWKGHGGIFKLAAGSCRLRIFDLSGEKKQRVAVLKPILVVVSDLPDETSYLKKVTVRSCCSHIATSVVKAFRLDHHRMVFVEYHPRKTYGKNDEKVIPEKFDVVDFKWFGDKALHPKWRAVKPPLLDTLKSLVS